MKRTDLTRRDFHRLTAAAFTGVLAGATVGCNNGDDGGDATGQAGDAATDDPTADGDSTGNGQQELVGGELPEYNACLGLNQCKEYGKNPGEHECAGQGACATVAHECAQKNTCKYLGGCDGKPAANECKNMGGCQVPLEPIGDEVWQQARAAFERRMKAKGVTVGEAPL